jgi:hypothetical protein
VTTSKDGFLVVLSDVKSEDDHDYFNWLTTEHVEERLGIPGFLAVRIFRMPIHGGHRYFIWYRLENSDVVDSTAYVERLNNPTPWSRRIMPTLGNFGRGGGCVAAFAGSESSSSMLAVGLNEVPSDPDKMVGNAKAVPGIGSAHLLITDTEKSEIRTRERDLRASNSSFAGVLIIESASQEALNRAAALPVAVTSNVDRIGGFYREVFALAR